MSGACAAGDLPAGVDSRTRASASVERGAGTLLGVGRLRRVLIGRTRTCTRRLPLDSGLEPGIASLADPAFGL